MSINRDTLNNDLQQKVNRPNAINKINTTIGDIAYSKTVNESTLIGRAAGEVVNGFKSLEQTQDFVNTVNKTGDALTQITEGISSIGSLPDPNNASFTLPTVSLDSGALSADLDKLLNFDSDTDLTGLFSSVGSIGGGIADTVSSIIKLITLLGTISKLTNISISGSATDALSAAGKSLSDKAANLTGSISDAVGNLGDIADVNSLSELSAFANNFNAAPLTDIVNSVSSIAEFNPLAEGLGAISNIDLGAVSALGDIGSTFGDVTKGVDQIGKDIDDILENGISRVTGKVLNSLDDVIGPINDVIVKSGGGKLQNLTEALNSEFSKNIVSLTGGVLVAKSSIGDLMDKVTSGNPLQVAQAAKSISELSNRIPDSMKSVISSIGDTTFANSRELVDSILSKATRDKVSQEDIEAFLSEFRSIESTLPTLSTTIQSLLERTDNDFFDENINLKDYGANYKNNPDNTFIRGRSINDVPSSVRDLFREVEGGIVHVPKKLSQQEYEAFAKRLERVNGIDWLSRYPTQEALDEYVRGFNGGTSALVDFGISVTLSHLKFLNGGGRRSSQKSTSPGTISPSNFTFTTVDSKEELSQEIMLIKRPILYLVVHSTESYSNQYLTANEIHRDHIDRGFEGIQYHYVIRRDGILERGLPNNSVTESSPKELRNFTIDIALVGGINAPSGVENPDQYRSIEAFTRQQLTTMESFIEAFYRRYPGGLVRGHYQIEDGVQDPHFDLKKYVKNRFGRE